MNATSTFIVATHAPFAQTSEKLDILGSHRPSAGEGAEGEGDRTPVDVGRRRRKTRPRKISALQPLTSEFGFKAHPQVFLFAFWEFLEYILVANSERTHIRLS